MNEEIQICKEMDDDGSSCGECSICNSVRLSDRSKTLDEKMTIDDLHEILMSNQDLDKLESPEDYE